MIRLLFALILVAAPAIAADLRIGRANEQSSLDPLFARTGNNDDTNSNIFDRLRSSDANNQPRPALALSWRAVEPTLWEIELRPGVAFHDGSAFTADDVIFSLERAKSVPNSPASFAGAVRGIIGLEAPDPLTLRIRTATPLPQLMEQIGPVYIMSRKAASGLSTADLNTGRGVVGTGPYKYVSASPGQSVELAANPAFWGGRPAWDAVSLRFIPQDASRVAALLAGDIDVAGQIRPSDVGALRGKATVASIGSTRLVYLALDSDRDRSPFVTDMQGKPLDRNPLKDVRVRQAISKLIDRRAIVGRLLDGSGEPAGQMVPQGLGGFDPALAPPSADVAAAKALLTEAGWAGGFGLTLHSSSDRFPGDAQIVQAIGQMLGRGGIKVNGVVAVPYAVYAAAATKQEYSAFIFTFGTTTSDSAIALTNVLATFDRDSGVGAFNRARYSNPGFDAKLRAASAEFDEARRNALLAEAAHIAFTDMAIVPLYWQVVHWASRNGIAVEPRRDESVSARYVTPVR